MKRVALVGVGICLLMCTNFAMANISSDISLHVDSAPNVYGSPDFPGWQDTTYAAIANGTFVNMSNGINTNYVGTTNFEIQDEVVYSFGDLGKRLHWVYWVPGETIATLTGNFEIKMENWENGEYLDFYNFYYGTTWLEPTKWEEYDADGNGTIDGVMGSAGMAWWGAYQVNTQEALDADIAEWIQSDETWTITAKLYGEEYSITSNRTGVAAVPAPGALLLGGLGTSLVGFLRRRKSL